jgi:hypothetical protein
MPRDILFVQRSIYVWGALDELAGACAQTGDLRAAVEIQRRLLASADLPEEERARIEGNLTRCLGALSPAPT